MNDKKMYVFFLKGILNLNDLYFSETSGHEFLPIIIIDQTLKFSNIALLMNMWEFTVCISLS